MASPAPALGRACRYVVSYRVTPRQFRLLCLATVWALALTIEVGAAVRLTGSGLSCPDWPACTGHSLVAPLQFHPWMEFANRLFNGTVTVGCIAVPLAAWRRASKRRDLLWLSGLLLLGLFAEVVLGGLTVLNDLAPGFVMAHFLLGAVFLGVSVVLHQRSTLPDSSDPVRPGWARPAGRPVLLVSPRLHTLAWLLILQTAVVVVFGTIVTSTGPHGGSPGAERFHLSLHDVAQLHGAMVELLVFLTLVTLWWLARSGAPRPVIRRATILLVAMVAQGAVGYAQYFTGDPAGVVAIHIAGAVAVIVAVLRFYLGLTQREADVVPEVGPVPAPPALVAG